MNTLTTEEFRERIKLICLGPNYVRRSNPALVRKPTDKGYNPPPQSRGNDEKGEAK